MVRILKEPKNSLIKQYTRLFEIDEVELTFDEDALQSVAKKAIERNTGARGLRSILEETMTQLMFDIPSREDIIKVQITKDCIESGSAPRIYSKDSTALPTQPLAASE